jgi:hypothetical protein
MASTKERLENDKLRLEIAKLRGDVTPRGRFASIILPTLVSTVTAVVAVTGIAVSIYTLHTQGEQQRKDAHDKLLQQALSMATDAGAASDRRISGIYQLGGFWGKPERDPADELIVAATLTALVVLDAPELSAKSDDPSPRDTKKAMQDVSVVRCAAAETIGAVLAPPAPNDASSVPQKRRLQQQLAAYAKTLDALRSMLGLGRDANQTRIRIAHLLYGNAKSEDQIGSHGLMRRQNSILWRKMNWGHIQGDSETTTLGCETPLAATREAIRKGYAYLALTDFHGNDLSYTRLYAADLRGAEFKDAELIGANMRCANLLDANITDEQLKAAADIRLANMPKREAGIPPLDHTITLSDENWHKWQSKQFKIPALHEWLGNGVSGYPDDFCLGEQPLPGATLKP